MKVFKRFILTFLALLLLVILFRGPLYRACVTYQSIGIRTNYSATDPELVRYIEEHTVFNKNPDAEKIVRHALTLTSDKLNFTAGRNENDPNRLIRSQTAHCVGYAAFFATTCNYLFRKYHLEDSWIAQPQQGQLYLWGHNVHLYIRTPFFKDHDFVIVRNTTTGKTIGVDPTVDDYLGIKQVTIR